MAVRLAVHRLATARRERGEGRGWSGTGPGGLAGDVRVAARGWAKSPGLALTIVLTVGLGLGASTAMVSVVRASLLDPLPYRGADRLERIYHAVSGNRWNLSVADYLAIEEHNRTLEAVGSLDDSVYTLGAMRDGMSAERLSGRTEITLRYLASYLGYTLAQGDDLTVELLRRDIAPTAVGGRKREQRVIGIRRHPVDEKVGVVRLRVGLDDCRGECLVQGDAPLCRGGVRKLTRAIWALPAELGCVGCTPSGSISATTTLAAPASVL